MKDKDILDALKQNYKHTIILQFFKDIIYIFKRNLGSNVDNFFRGTNHHVLRASHAINQKTLRDYFSAENNKKETSVDEEEATLEGETYIKDFMSEVYRIYKASAEEEINANDTLILKAFSLTLKSAVAQEITEIEYEYKDKTTKQTRLLPSSKRDFHYIFIIPTEWEHGIKEKTILPLFKKAGLVDEEDHPCKLLFYTELDAILEKLQDYSKYPDIDEQKLQFDSGREYILWKLDPAINVDTLSMTYSCFETSDPKSNNRRIGESKQYGNTVITNPVSVYSNNKIYSLTLIDTIRQSVWTFLEAEGIIEVFPPARMSKEKEKNIMIVIDMLIKAALIFYSKMLKDGLYLSESDLLRIYPFAYLDLTPYNPVLNSAELLKSIDMLEIHEIMFRDNEAVIEELLNDVMIINDGSRSSINTRRRIILAYNNYRRNITRPIELPGKLATDSTSQWTEALGVDTEMFVEADIVRIKLSHLYIEWIYCFILKFRNDTNYQTLFDQANLPYCCIYDTSAMTHYAALKFENTAAFLVNRLSPLLLSLPCSFKKDGVLQDSQFTKNSNPEYIVKIDVKLFEPSTFSCVQLDYHGKKGSVKAMLTDENRTDYNYKMSLPALSNYLKPNSTDGSFDPKKICITARLLEIINTHFKYALNYFSKYDRQTSKNEELFALEQKLDFKDRAALTEQNNCLLFRSFDDMIPEIKLELKKSEGEKEISQQCYIKVFLMIYLGVLKYYISTFLEEETGKKGDVADENTIIGYTILVDAFFFHTYLKESYSILVELVIASGFAKDEENYKSNVRVITDREEQLLPVLEQKIGKSLPLKSFYVHGRMYERYLHITLNQVVIEGLLPYQNSKNIVIKSKVIPIPYLLDMICDNLWDAAQNRDYVVPRASYKHCHKDHAFLQSFSSTSFKEFSFKYFFYEKMKLFFKRPISKSDDISAPISFACGCRLNFGSEDIFDLGIIPAIKYSMSVFLGAITNEDIFGLYGIEHFFVAFNYFTSAFHRSYQKYFECNLKKLIDINLEKKRLKIPYTVFPEPIGGLLQPVINESCILADSFLYGNILQAFGETYSLSFRNRGVYRKVFVDGGYRMLEEKETITIVEKGETIPRTGVKTEVLYVRSRVDSCFHFRADVTKKALNSSTNNTIEQPIVLDDYMIDSLKISSELAYLDRNPLYSPLCIAVKYLNYSSSVMLTIKLGTGFEYHKPNDIVEIIDKDNYLILAERLKIINTQSK